MYHSLEGYLPSQSNDINRLQIGNGKKLATFSLFRCSEVHVIG